ncbi:MAG: hypothetical protein ACOX6N_00620 [Patescibacteria group bacterium]|jgi:hypothetical protein
MTKKLLLIFGVVSVAWLYGFSSIVVAQNLVCYPEGGMGCSPGQSCYGRNKLNEDTLVITNNKNYTVVLEALENICSYHSFDNLSNPTPDDWRYQCNGNVDAASDGNPNENDPAISADRYLYCLRPGETINLRVEVPNDRTGQLDVQEKDCPGGSCGCYDNNGIYWQGGMAFTIWSNNTGTSVPRTAAPCNSYQVTGMNVRNPADGTNRVRVGDTIDFVLGGCQGHEYINNDCRPNGDPSITNNGGLANHGLNPDGSMNPRTDCDPTRFWAPDNVTAYRGYYPGNYTWTRSWVNCRDDYPSICSSQCSQSVNYSIINEQVDIPKRCSVTVSSSDVNPGGSVTLTVSGVGNSLGEPVRMFLEKSDGGVVSGTALSSYPMYTNATGNNYYQIGTTTYSQTNVPATFSRTITNLPLGTYFVHCDLPSSPPNPGPDASKCSGNPFCPPPPGIGSADSAITASRDNCDGWLSCSSSDYGKFSVVNSAPTVGTFSIRTPADVTVPGEHTGNLYNQVCDQRFVSGATERMMRLVVEASDAQGASTISRVVVRMVNGSNTITLDGSISGSVLSISTSNNNSPGTVLTSTATTVETVNSTTRRYIFPIRFESTMAERTYDIEVRVQDSMGVWSNNGSYTDTTRNLKIWDCNVEVSGSMYDKTGTSGVCPDPSLYTTVLRSSYSLLFDGIGTEDKAMTVVPTTDPQYHSNSNGNHLRWGKQYQAVISGFTDGSEPMEARLDDLGRVGEIIGCNLNFIINSSVVNPYSANTNIMVDFSSYRHQDPWYQVEGGGIVGENTITREVPSTCASSSTCIPALDISTTSSNNGLVIAGQLNPASGSYGSPNNWYRSGASIVDDSYGYDFFFNRYYQGMGEGELIDGNATSSQIMNLVNADSELEMVFVNGNLNITTTPIDLVGNRFLMVVVKGSITVDESVSRVEGVYVGNGSFSAGGDSTSRLTISGIILANGVQFTRSYTDASTNNTSPAVVVTYNPAYIFSMSKDLKEAVSWYYGD